MLAVTFVLQKLQAEVLDSDLSPVLSAAVIGVTVDVYMKQPDLSTVLKLKSFVVMDVRHETEGDAYRQLIAPVSHTSSHVVTRSYVELHVVTCSHT